MRQVILYYYLLQLVTGLGPCEMSNPNRTNIFMAWIGAVDSMRSTNVASVESVYFNYPEANVVLFGDGLQGSVFGTNLDSVHQLGYCLSFIQTSESFHHVQLVIYQYQLMYGGLYVPMDGGLLHTMEHVVSHIPLSRSIDMFMEIIRTGRTDGLAENHFSEYLWGRPETDLKPNVTFACSVDCVRHVEKGSRIVHAFLGKVAESGLLTHPDILLTDVISSRIMQVIMLPFWLVAEPKFPDHWANFGSQPGFTDSTSDLHSPRLRRYRQDYWLITTHKLWLPWSRAASAETNVFPKSVIALVRQEFSLHLFSNPFRPIGSVKQERLFGLKSPLDQMERLMTNEQLAMRGVFPMRQVALPGNSAGYRTSKHIKVVNAPPLCPLSVNVSSSDDSIGFYLSASPPQESVTLSGTLAEINFALSQLYYLPSSHVVGQDFTTLVVSVRACDETVESRIDALRIHPEGSITVIAHSANRCELLKRLVSSVRLRYTKVKISVTCECDPDDKTCPIDPTRIDISTDVDWYQVPFDFGLSRGKSFLISQVTTEFVLVLDDDFVFTYSTCVECMILKMKSRLHSALLPLDIVGIPILEDERAFGAFRGSLSLSDSRFAVDPIVKSTSPDGCARVDICPMVFLGRSARMKLFHWDENLPVGEHEIFFLSNQAQGIQVAVCSDSTLTHFRVPVGGSTAEYRARRERQRDYMRAVFANIGISHTMYLFQKYSHHSYRDVQSLAHSGVPLEAVRDDSSELQDPVVVSSVDFLFFVLSSASDDSARERHRCDSCPLGILNRTRLCRVWFLVDSKLSRLPEEERDEHGDIVLVPSDRYSLKFVLETIRKFSFKICFLLQDTRTLDLQVFSDTISSLVDTRMRIFPGDGLLGLSEDFVRLISHPMILPFFKKCEHCDGLLEELLSWTSIFNVEAVPLITTPVL